MTDARVAAIVLAGGASRRFGRDKLAEPIDGQVLLERAIDAVRVVADEVVVVLAPDDGRPLPPGTRPVHDQTAHQGPLVGLSGGLAAVSAAPDRVIVVGGDMPSLEPEVLRVLIDALDRTDLVCLEDRDGRARPLPMAIRRGPGTNAVDALVGAGERRLRDLLDRLPTETLSFARWSVFDPTAATLVDIDAPTDLPGRPLG